MDRDPLSAIKYHEILESSLASLFAGCDLDAPPLSCSLEDALVIVEGEDVLLLRPDPIWPYCFRLRRTHPFGTDDVDVLRQFLKAFHEKLTAADQPFFPYLLNKCPQDVVAWSVKHRSVDDSLLPFIITTLLKWASQTYEGDPVSVAIGVDHLPDISRVSTTHLYDIIGKDFTKVITNGMDTLLVLSPSGYVVEHLVLPDKAPDATRSSDPSYAPSRYYALAKWAKGSRVALVLNKHGELLVFSKQRLEFAYRRGAWSHFSHAAMVQRIEDEATDRLLSRAAYDSCLDVSFARTGGCLAIVKPEHAHKMSDYLSSGDILQLAETEKSTVLRHLIGVPFAEIPRLLRQEIMAIDGAVIIDPKGNVRAAGAIVRVPGGSEGGGRRAAAKALSRLGLAVKMSTDGGIAAFTDAGTRKKPEVAFEVCA